MYVSQTAVTQQIRSLEDMMGVQLFVRTKKKVELTPAGQVFAGEAQQILDHIENAFSHARDASEGMVGNLDAGFTSHAGNLLFTNNVQEFHQRFPNVQIRFHSDSPTALLERLKTGELDLIFSPIFDESVYEGCEVMVLQQTSLMVVLPSEHRLAHRRHLTRYDLEQEKLILACSPDGKIGEDRMIIESFHQAGLYPEVVDKMEDIESILLMISVHMGISILPSYIPLPVSNERRIDAIPYEREVQVAYAAVWLTENGNPSLKQLIGCLEG
jgi:DNA-binding transcriptional LysR family regulator